VTVFTSYDTLISEDSYTTSPDSSLAASTGGPPLTTYQKTIAPPAKTINR
jgi:hypothetical protein